MKCDVLILGGGGAGLAAAVAAARAGARTVLIERHGTLGGMATAALVHSICGLYLLREEPGAVLAHRGIPGEFAARLLRAGAAHPPVRMGRVDVLPHHPTGFAAVADQWTAGCPNLEVRLHTELIAATGAGRVETVETICRGQRFSLEPQAVVDASGDAILTTLAGGTTDQAPAERLQRPAYIFALHTVEVAALGDDARIQIAHQLVQAVRAGKLESGCLGAQIRATGWGSEVFVTIDLAAGAAYDPTDPLQLTALEQEGRRLATQLAAFLRAEHPAFRQSAVGTWPARVGIRESRRVRGKAALTSNAVRLGTVCEDEVARGTWPIESRERATGPRWIFPEANRPTSIPLGALQSADLANLWTAGRCLSCDHEAQAALRVIGTCLATGQAAGLAAALQADGQAATAATVRAQIETVLVPEEERCA